MGKSGGMIADAMKFMGEDVKSYYSRSREAGQGRPGAAFTGL